MSSLLIKLESVDYGRTKNWLVFKGFIPQHNINKLYTFEFCGTELNTGAYLTDSFKDQLQEKLIENFGYPPFSNLKGIQDKLGDENYSRIELRN
ncbi:TPA: hypothetical protein TZM69_000388 [Streptococcus suis]|nr:hypothetical protein [Streptococcus suis]HEL1739421.1 hypothetical protein [Streptococcus suis]HEL2171847.1 hypothetical protein [Streptococcus suis]HEL2172946.1 hypothetical protein [Streptococcus suis]HEL2302510.1 hypothetical protein [Streptococcus suis]